MRADAITAVAGQREREREGDGKEGTEQQDERHMTVGDQDHKSAADAVRSCDVSGGRRRQQRRQPKS